MFSKDFFFNESFPAKVWFGASTRTPSPAPVYLPDFLPVCLVLTSSDVMRARAVDFLFCSTSRLVGEEEEGGGGGGGGSGSGQRAVRRADGWRAAVPLSMLRQRLEGIWASASSNRRLSEVSAKGTNPEQQQRQRP